MTTEKEAGHESAETALREELVTLLKKNSDAKGVLNKGSLRTPDGKRMLEITRVELRLNWLEMTRLLQKSKTTLEKLFSEHGIRKAKDPHTDWSPERVALVKEWYGKSGAIRTKDESAKLRDEMVREVNKLPGKKVGPNAIRCMARDYEWGVWGYRTREGTGTHGFEKRVSARVEELVNDGALAKMPAKEGLAALYKKISEEFPGVISEKTFQKRVERIVWEGSSTARKRDRALQDIVRVNLDSEKEFHPRFPNIPLEFVKTRTRWHRGVNTTAKRTDRALPGIGRIRASKELGDLSKFVMPQTSFATPFAVVPLVKLSDCWTLMILNGANFGTRHGRDIVGNVARRALSEAKERGDKAVILTNILTLDLKKAGGPIKVGRGLVMGDNINPNIFADPVYRGEAERIVRESPKDEMVYQTSEELLDNVLAGWRKVCVKPDKKPEYDGPIFIILGINEEELIRSVAYWELNYWTKRKQSEISALLSVAKHALAEALKEEEFKRAEELERELDTLQERLNRTVITNVASQEQQRFYEQARALVVRKIEQAIPRAKVIGQNSTYLLIGGKRVKMVIPGHDKVTDTLLADFSRGYGPEHLGGELADATVICHPWSLQFRMTVREADSKGKRGSARVFVAPIAVDDVFLRSVLKTTVRKSHPLGRAVFDGTFKSGVLRLSCTNGGLIDADVLSVESLEKFKEYKNPRMQNGTRCALYGRGPKYLWIHTATDQHWGGRAKEFVTSRLPGERKGMRLGATEAVFELMRQGKLCEKDAMRVHLFATNDDPTQGQNFPARTQPDPHERSFHDTEQEWLKMLAEAKRTEDPKAREEIVARAGEAILSQLEKRGSDFPHEQMLQMITRHVSANADVFSAILSRNQNAGLIIRGVGEFGNAEHGGHDTRNVGVVNFGSGNHLGNTVDGEIIEGPFYALHLRTLLLGMPKWQGEKALLEKLIVAPLYSGTAMAWGTVKVPHGYEYGLDLRASPPRMAGWGDPLLGAVRNDSQRGNYSRIFEGRLTLKTYGDKHFFAAVRTQYAFYHMCAAGTHTDCYGERGFPPNNTGVSFVGLPADGPESGPILLRILPIDVIRDFVETNPRPFDWEKFLPNPA
ncbi:MAG: hypothetical protein A3D67_03835 [Candidatus Lloydbacteria bacterium RIFCSPHIGHO2_02_FULL_51_22]|uniref:Uncharacterized protein n=1 Tax=Candidatus Lloydbacteria bacterium RIFCSPHIGHO2_02_FULL_51_22 TaxID=1798663 RepID=A0A1G2D9U8_9BACT|nr:MAG: hypothetical protein A3D67_03835 [Candidatus Lloydbacteria bacterium RIFCSPHIGHO2_02_FULL_51_22]